MRSKTVSLKYSGFLLKRALPILVLTGCIGLGVLGLLIWAGQEADRVSYNRQASLAQLVVSQQRSKVAHNQESVTVWDDAVEQVRARDSEWMDNNLGAWMHEYFGLDQAYVLDPSNQAVYAFADGGQRAPDAFSVVEDEALPLVLALRDKLRVGDDSQVSDTVLTPGVSDLAVIQGRPAVVSVKPIVSDTGDIQQTPGEESVHVAVRFLDGSLIEELKTDYLFEDLHFSWSASDAPHYSSLPFYAADGSVLGYMVWHPHHPGETMLSKLIPVLSAFIVLALCAIAFSLFLYHNRSKELQASEEQIRYMALHDPLTELPNRNYFNEYVDVELTKGGASALLFLDLDRFKQVNDTLGHPSGDALIREFGQRLKAIVRQGDVVARVGGDEFTVMLRGKVSVGEVDGICQRIVDSVRRPFVLGGQEVFVGVSVGVALAPRDGNDRVSLLRRADVALYFSKNSGRSRYTFFSENMDQLLSRRQEMEGDMRAALKAGNEFQVHYQPIIDARDHRVKGYEALLRWEHPKFGSISPELFIPVAEETGLIDAVGAFVLREACTAAAEWSGKSVAVNVSGIELRDEGYAAKVKNILLSTGLSPQALELEVTETAATDEASAVVANLDALRAIGVQIAIDDFGTGFSSLGRLRTLNVDRIKIDRSFVRGFGEKAGDEAIIRAIVELAHASGLKTTAEGVETSFQDAGLIRIGCDSLQGFLYSKPVPLRDIELTRFTDSSPG
ncbi:EAL domain-containing protein [Martelella lutilitoris]|uniref:EAL domain-containing protein n=1 Tax=Martelella lutilitoris TaxID=2583532 RepID=A0A7T7HMX4_9HYPH|nr:EAL domain-containing protein [Martelella lutilitoris]QQM32130.1 EAL domain-containing protein [Martelella lutilitoris]